MMYWVKGKANSPLLAGFIFLWLEIRLTFLVVLLFLSSLLSLVFLETFP